MLKNFRAYQTAILFYKMCEPIKCNRHLKDQLVRASSSIALNLSEGSARPTVKDRKRFYYIALSSLRECQTILELIEVPNGEEILDLSDKLGAQIFKLCQSIKINSQN